MQEHNLIKTSNGYRCEVCCRDWFSIPQRKCPGCRHYEYDSQPENLLTLINLHKKNLWPEIGTLPEGAIYLYKARVWLWLYDQNKCVADDPHLPPIYQWDDRHGLRTVGELRKINLVPNPEKKPSGVAWVWDRKTEWGKWIGLYSEADCQWEAKDSWLTKTALKTVYLLSDGWLKNLGPPDKTLPNPHYRRAAPVQLYSRKRVEKFLADNAEGYAQWLDKRDRYLAIFEANREKIFARRNLLKQQTQMCLNCACGMAMYKGFFCAVHPLGQEDMPCRDWHPRDKNI